MGPGVIARLSSFGSSGRVQAFRRSRSTPFQRSPWVRPTSLRSTSGERPRRPVSCGSRSTRRMALGWTFRPSRIPGPPACLPMRRRVRRTPSASLRPLWAHCARRARPSS